MGLRPKFTRFQRLRLVSDAVVPPLHLAFHKNFTCLTHNHTVLQSRSLQKQIIEIEMCITALYFHRTFTNISKYPSSLCNFAFSLLSHDSTIIDCSYLTFYKAEKLWLAQVHTASKSQTWGLNYYLFAVCPCSIILLDCLGTKGKRYVRWFSENHTI